jgi:hypothetical protein
MGKQAKLRQQRRQGARKPIRPLPVPLPEPEPFDYGPRPGEPYESDEDLKVDAELVRAAWRQHYPVDEMTEDFMPPLILNDREGVRPAEWIETFRGLMIEKYGATDDTSDRISFMLERIADEHLDLIYDALRL